MLFQLFQNSSAQLLLHGESLVELEISKKNEVNFSEQVYQAIVKGVSENLINFIDDTHTRVLLETHTSVCEDLINSVVPEKITITGLTKILRQLIL